MNNQFFCKHYKWLFILVCITILDIGIKFWVRSNLFVGEVMYIAPGINLCYLNNSGLAFGLLSNIKTCYWWILICIMIFVIIMFCFSFFRSIKDNILYDSISYSMIIGGALGNLYDRILYGVVIDFIDLYIGTWHWPIFNIADIEIFMGLFCLTIRHIIYHEKI